MIWFSVVLILLLIIVYYKWAFSYWRKKGVPCVEPTIPFGNIQALITSQLYVGTHLKNAYLLFKQLGHKHAGMYLLSWPRYLPIDRNIIKHILIQEFDYFNDRGFYYNEKDDPLSANLFSLSGERWRNLRSRLSPVFTSGKLRFMFDSLLRCGYQLQLAMENLSYLKNTIEVRELSICYSINVIGLCAFGVDCNCFENPNSDFRKFGKKVFDYTSWFRRIKMCFAFAMPNLALWLGVEAFGKDYTDFFTNIVQETIDYREKHNVVSKDLIQLLIEIKDNWKKDMSMEELAAQVFIFFSAGFETTSTSLTFCLYELGLNLNIQKKVREEITTTLSKYQNNFTYEAVSNMKYMNQVIEETLRKYPPVAFIGRRCVKDCKIPGTAVILEKDMYIDISILGIHHDPEYYPEPEKFDPERFSEKNKNLRNACTYLPFGDGPRTCIGMRFAITQLKVALVVLLKQHQFTVHSTTTIPVVFEPYSFTLHPKTGIFMTVNKI
ncbi:hypothetical protein RN001_001631 [Aquatica leii]|uniref:Cytochrome P450 n=1 Tax=Aquatica leii TaxID=1421715 RepID=A0AAN7SSP0_9COLE|nr:hypothetical protein RN001_001631 [Aquatica leii]